jgi:UDP-N-acetylmuramate dehydrogenase
VFSSQIEKNVSLAPFNSLKVDAVARGFAQIQSIERLENLLNNSSLPFDKKFVLGGGSNVLFVNDFEGLIIYIAIRGKEIVQETDDHVWLKVGAGENWHNIVRYCVKNGWGGVENLSLIPGTAGAAPIQNIGAYGAELQEVFDSLTAVEMQTGKRRTYDKEACNFGYRDSIFKQELKGEVIVTNVTLKLAKNPVLNTSYGALKEKIDERDIADPTVADISDIVIEIRQSKLPDPSTLGNAGSFFKNPVITNDAYENLKKSHSDMPGYDMKNARKKVPAGWLIEQAGWKGKVVGSVGTYRQQALVIVNHGGATGKEILALSQEIQKSVKQMFDIALVPEVNIVK